jgi:hypothetical protein
MLIIYFIHAILLKITTYFIFHANYLFHPCSTPKNCVKLSFSMDKETEAEKYYIIYPKAITVKCHSRDTNLGNVDPSSCP